MVGGPLSTWAMPTMTHGRSSPLILSTMVSPTLRSGSLASTFWLMTMAFSSSGSSQRPSCNVGSTISLSGGSAVRSNGSPSVPSAWMGVAEPDPHISTSLTPGTLRTICSIWAWR